MKNKNLPLRSGWLWFSEGWKLFKKSPFPLILGAAMWIVLELLFAFIPLVGGFIDGLIFPMLYAGFLFNASEIENARKPELKNFFIGFTDKSKFVPLLMLGLLVVIFEVATIAFAMIFGPITVVIFLPLAIMMFSALLFSVPLVTFKGTKVGEAFTSSYQSCGNNISAIIMLYFVLLGLMVLSVVTFGLGLIVIIPLTFCALYKGYQDIYG